MNAATLDLLRREVDRMEKRRAWEVSLVEQQRGELAECEARLATLDREIAELRADLSSEEVFDFPGSYVISIGLSHLVDPVMHERPLCGIPNSAGAPARRRDLPAGVAWLCSNCRRAAPSKGYWRG